MKIPNLFLIRALALPLLCMLLLIACSGPGKNAALVDATAGKPAARTMAEPSAGNPAGPAAPTQTSRPTGSATTAASSGTIRLGCRTNADCVIKDIGSCCGYQPRCMNKDSQTFPEQVQARCAKDGRVGICGMLAITGCECVAGTCAAITVSDNNSLVQ